MKRVFATMWLSTLLLSFFACQPDTGPPACPTPPPDKEESKEAPGYFEEWHRVKMADDGQVHPLPYAELKAWDEAHRYNKDAPEPILDLVNELGPDDVGGRTRALLIDRGNTSRWYAGGVSGGLWISKNSGDSWDPVDDNGLSLKVTDVIQDPNNYNNLYFTTGEIASGSSPGVGKGVFRSRDRGLSFEQLPTASSSAFRLTSALAHDPNTSGTFYICTRYNGMYKATYEGDTVKQCLNQPGGAFPTDVEVTNAGTVVAGIHREGIFYSSTGEPGSFSKAAGLPPDSTYYAIKLAYTPASGGVLYCVLEDTLSKEEKDTPAILNAYQRIYKSTDEGQNWAPVPDPPTMKFHQDWYCLAIGVAPNNANRIVVGAVSTFYSLDGGQNWQQANSGHADNHVFATHPSMPDKFLIGNDGGVYESDWNTASTTVIDHNNGYNVTQFYAGDYYPTNLSAIGGTQDNQTRRLLNGLGASKAISCCDGAFCWISRTNGSMGYTSTQNGYMNRVTQLYDANPNSVSIMSNLDGPDADNDPDEGSWFITRFYMNTANDQQLYFLSKQGIWRTQNGGNSWTKITDSIPDIYSLAVEPVADPTIYALGSNNQRFLRIDNANSATPTVTDLSASMFPGTQNKTFHGIELHPQDPSILYTCISNTGTAHQLFKITDAKSANPTWHLINGDLPPQLPVNYITPDPLRPDSVLFAGTDFGLYYTLDGGQHWNKEFRVPSCPVFQVKIRPSDRTLFVFTHGRGIYTASLLNPGEAYADLPYSYSFDSPSGAYWDFYSSTLEGEVIQTVEHSPVDGAMCLSMDVKTNGSFNTNQADLRLNLRNYSDVLLTFDWKHFSEESHPEDGLFASADGGETFTKIWSYDLVMQASDTWKAEYLNLDNLCEAAGVPYTGTFVLRFQQRDNFGIPTDGIALDDIEITGKAYATIPYFTGFSPGTFDEYWSTGSTSRSGRSELSLNNGILNGWYLAMDRSPSGDYSSSYADLHLDLEGTQLPRLLFWWKHFHDEPHTEDGIYFSDDGGDNFSKVWSFPISTTPADSWKLEDIDVNLLANSNGLSKSRRFVIRFQQHDNYPIPSDGIGIDNVELRGMYHSPLPYATGFDMGGFDKYWLPKPYNPDGRIRVTQEHGPLHGGFHAVMDMGVDNVYNTNEMILGLQLAGECNVTMSYAMKDLNDETHPEDGVYLSSNAGATWHKIKDFDVQPAQHNVWLHDTLDISYWINQLGLFPTNWFAIKFQQRDNYPAGTDGIAIDDVVINSGNCKDKSDPSAPASGLSAEVFPNPARDFVNLRFTGENLPTQARVQIFDLQGKTVLSQSLRVIGSVSEKLNLNELSSGTYFIDVRAGELSLRKKLAIQR